MAGDDSRDCEPATVVVNVGDVTVHVSGFTGERDSFDRPRVARRTDARFVTSSFDCLPLISCLLPLLVIVGMWLIGSVRTGDVEDASALFPVVLTTTYANLKNTPKRGCH
jgi:hypothetical protein